MYFVNLVSSDDQKTYQCIASIAIPEKFHEKCPYQIIFCQNPDSQMLRSLNASRLNNNELKTSFIRLEKLQKLNVTIRNDESFFAQSVAQTNTTNESTQFFAHQNVFDRPSRRAISLSI